MSVILTVSETLDGAEVSDSLLGGGTGVDLGQVTNNSYAPLISKGSNTGKQDLYVAHDGTNEVTDVKVYCADYELATGETYGGARTSAEDYTAVKALGAASGSSKNNSDGLSGGLWLDMDADASTTNQFDQANFPTLVKIFGDNGTDGIDLASAFTLAADAMVYDNTGETLASAGEAGKIGPAGNTVLGDSAHLKTRIYIPDAYAEGGYMQAALVFLYTFTS